MDNLHHVMRGVLEMHGASETIAIADILRGMGYGYRKTAGADHGQREIYHIESGAIVGLYRAEQAIDAAKTHAEGRS